MMSFFPLNYEDTLNYIVLKRSQCYLEREINLGIFLLAKAWCQLRFLEGSLIFRCRKTGTLGDAGTLPSVSGFCSRSPLGHPAVVSRQTRHQGQHLPSLRDTDLASGSSRPHTTKDSIRWRTGAIM